MNTFQTIVNRVTNHIDSPPHVAGQVAQRLLDAAQDDTNTALQHSGAALQGLTNADASQR
jgi:hypothetical protein